MKKILFILGALFFASAAIADEVGKGDRRQVHPPKITEYATFAAGCFWCIQPAFDKLDGVIETHVGFSGGSVKDPTYAEVSAGKTGHAESIEIKYNARKISYEKLLEVFWSNVDPTDGEGQYVDRGSQYRPIIFYRDHDQERAAIESKQKIEAAMIYSRPIAVQIIPFTFFSPAKGKDAQLHEKYYKKDPVGYELYKKGSGRTKELQQLNK